MALSLTIDASALTGGFNSRSYFGDFLAGLANSAMTYYGGTPNSAFGGTYYVNGSQVVARYEDGSETEVANAVILDGSDIAYDFIHYGSTYGHGISGQVDSMVFGQWIDGTTDGEQGTGDAGRVSGFGAGVVVDGLGLSADPGAGSDRDANPVYDIYKAVQLGEADALQDIFADYAVEMTGTGQRDRLFGYGNDDVLFGRDGNDVANGKGGDNVVIGGQGNDRLVGGGGADMLLGGAGADRLKGGGHADWLRGGSGDDTLNGGSGDDMLTGGAGTDTFVFDANAGADTVTDFDTTTEVLDVTALGLTGMDDFTVTEFGGAVTLTAGEVSITLTGVAASDLDTDNFLF